jgi:hypothetical protein
VSGQPICHRTGKEFACTIGLEERYNSMNLLTVYQGLTFGMRLAELRGSARLVARISTTFLEGFTMKSMLMAIMAVAVAVSFSAPSFAGDEKKKEEKKGGHVVVFGDEKKKEEKKGGHVVFGDEKKKEEKGGK